VQSVTKKSSTVRIKDQEWVRERFLGSAAAGQKNGKSERRKAKRDI
jgi:hypothetical protein